MEYPIKEGGLPGFKKDNSIAPMASGSKKSGTVNKTKVNANSIWPVANASKKKSEGGRTKSKMAPKPNSIKPDNACC